MRPRVVKVDDVGLHLESGFVGSLDVLFDGRRTWSAAVDEADQALVPWPKRLAEHLVGTSSVTVTTSGGKRVFDEDVVFGTGEGRVRVVDRFDNPIVIDKWGLPQRPFDTRRDGAVEAMAQMAERVLQIMRDECDLEGWIGFGTLLGAARGGKVIGHDSDIDLCFLSEKATPAEMALEMWGLARALTRAGITVKHKTASFLTVLYDAPDGGTDGLDIYTCFYVGDLLHETATVRQEVPPEAILPLQMLEFEGRQLPAPADPDALLTASYGPGWRVPDPSFRHLPGPEITDRFDAWFGLLMPQRREWTAYNTRLAKQNSRPSDFATWVTEHLDARPEGLGRIPGRQVHVVDLGSGASADVQHYADQGHLASGCDYAHPTARPAKRGEGARGARRQRLNLFSMRETYSFASHLALRDETFVVTARELLEALHPQARDGFWQFTSMLLGSGGRVYLEGVGRSTEDCETWQQDNGAGRLWPVDPHEVAEHAAAVGATVVHREGFAAASRAAREGGLPARWRMILQWPVSEESET